MARSKPDDAQPNELIYLGVLPLEASAPLESSAALDYQTLTPKPAKLEGQPDAQGSASASGATTVPPFHPVMEEALPQAVATAQPVADQPGVEQRSPRRQGTSPNQLQQPNPSTTDPSTPDPLTNVVEQETIRLLEERLVVDRKKRKVGDVIVRKEIETHMIEVPVRREKLIVEQISPEHRQLAEIALGDTAIDGVELTGAPNATLPPVIHAEFASAKAASQFLATIASQPSSNSQPVQIKLVVDSLEQQALYQQWLDRYLANQSSTDTAP